MSNQDQFAVRTLSRAAPVQLLIICVTQARLDDREVRRDIKVSWHEETMVADMKDLPNAILAVRRGRGFGRDDRQDRVSYALKSLSDQS